MATGNPAMNEAVYQRAVRVDSRVMTLEGSVVKTVLLMAILLVTGGYSWTQAITNAPIAPALISGGAIGGLIVAFLTIFVPRFSPITAPIYAALEGLALGAISAMFNLRYPGIVGNAIGLSIGILAGMLFVYGTGVIRATDKLRIGIVAATGGICLIYIIDMVLGMFGVHVPFIHQTGPIGIIFSVVVVVVAALNLILDFDFIERGVRFGAPKYMEWYGGFSLLVTLVWMYLEILRLLAKTRSRD